MLETYEHCRPCTVHPFRAYAYAFIAPFQYHRPFSTRAMSIPAFSTSGKSTRQKSGVPSTSTSMISGAALTLACSARRALARACSSVRKRSASTVREHSCGRVYCVKHSLMHSILQVVCFCDLGRFTMMKNMCRLFETFHSSSQYSSVRGRTDLFSSAFSPVLSSFSVSGCSFSSWQIRITSYAKVNERASILESFQGQ